MMCVSNELAGLGMTSVAGTLSIHRRRKLQVQALHITVLIVEWLNGHELIYFAFRKLPKGLLHISLHTKNLFPSICSSCKKELGRSEFHSRSKKFLR